MARPTLIYSSKSSSPSIKPHSGYSRGSSRASTPPSTPYYQSLDVDPIATLRALAREDSPSGNGELQQRRPSSSNVHHATAQKHGPQPQRAWKLKRPSKASILHYASLILSVRLLFHAHKLSFLLLTMVLAITLEGRARMEKLGLRGTMTLILAVVCAGLGVGNLSVGDGWSGVASGIWTSAGTCRDDGDYGTSTLIFTGKISGSANANDLQTGHSSGASLLKVSVCTAASIQRRRESGGHRLLETAKTHFTGSSRKHVSVNELCRSAVEDLELVGRNDGDIIASGKRVFHLRIAVQPTHETDGIATASDSITTCTF